ncbi:MAG: RsmB/NOP family class I SAM-dependent RNA methyltransferase [Nitratireductor sp.]|nr:RsmB/NOP family class I SAM-dependent RNA methyltransferase [Nitratireductor sp.]MCB1455516.1 RsmB/NOP family class I SAM-dependent RNA methyltransferase [Nitratireductor sp.]
MAILPSYRELHLNKNSNGYRPAGRDRVGLAARVVGSMLVEMVLSKNASLDALCDEAGGLAALRALPLHDRRLARAIAVTALRQRPVILAALNSLLDRPLPRKAEHLLATLQVAAAQILFMNVPQSAAVNLAVTAVSEDVRSRRFAPLANAVLRRLADDREALSMLVPAPRDSFNSFLSAQLASDHGRERLRAISEAIRIEPAIDLTIGGHVSAERRSVLMHELDAAVLPNETFRLRNKVDDLKLLPGYSEGEWWVQDAAASLPARMLGEVAGLKVADLCAAPGGKTAQLASAGALVTAVDKSARRMKRLRENLARLRLEAELVEADLLEWKPGPVFDAVILDAPCSATGTMRRHPEIAWNVEAEQVNALARLQHEMIMAASAMVKPGGTIVYVNCSILKREGEDLLAAIIRADCGLRHVRLSAGELAGADFAINGQGALRTLPGDRFGERAEELGMDGFFACRFETVGTNRV